MRGQDAAVSASIVAITIVMPVERIAFCQTARNESQLRLFPAKLLGLGLLPLGDFSEPARRRLPVTQSRKPDPEARLGRLGQNPLPEPVRFTRWVTLRRSAPIP
jgi:hypothetical protein